MKLSELDERLLVLRERAKEVRDPTAADETLELILELLEKHRPNRILEIGAAEGLTSCAMLMCSHAHLTAIERNADRASCAPAVIFVHSVWSPVRNFTKAMPAKYCPFCRASMI